jgi:hypothetical protein
MTWTSLLSSFCTFACESVTAVIVTLAGPAGLPHHFSLRTSTVSALRTELSIRNGPADSATAGSKPFHPVVKKVPAARSWGVSTRGSTVVMSAIPVRCSRMCAGSISEP